MKRKYFLNLLISVFLFSSLNAFALTPKPVITAFKPASVIQGSENQQVIIRGRGFIEGLTVSFKNDGITVNSAEVLSASRIKATITVSSTAKTGYVKVVIILPDTRKAVSKKFLVKKKLSEQPITFKIKNNETTLSWDSKGFAFARIDFVQGNKSIAKIVENSSLLTLSKELIYNFNTETWETDYTQFQDFVAGENLQINLSLSNSRNTDYQNIGSITAKALIHRFDTIESSQISLTSSFPDQVNKGGKINLSGKALADFRADVSIKLPSKFVENVRMTTSGTIKDEYFGPKLPKGSDFTLSYNFQDEGVYIIEINGYAGSASLNRPVYVGAGIPIVPLDNYFPKFDGSFDLATFRQEWLALINEERESVGLNAVTLDPILNKAGQGHTNDMKANNYFGHINPQGEGPQQRAEAEGIPEGGVVGENLSWGNSVLGMHVGLEESPAHEANILNPKWSRVGLGITLTDDGMLIGAQEFGAYPGDMPLAVDTF